LIVPIAGVFIFLPILLVSWFVPPPADVRPADALNALAEYWQANWYWYGAEAVIGMIGSLAILLLVLVRGGTTVGGAIAGAFALLPFYLVAAMLTGAMIGLGFLLLIVPGLYLFGRLAPLPALFAGERPRNPLEAILRTFALTRGNGWAILGLILLIAVPAWLATALIRAVFGVLLIALAGQHVGLLLTTIVTAAAAASLSVVLVLLYAALYRRLTRGI
jgi:hypothetical protein